MLSCHKQIGRDSPSVFIVLHPTVTGEKSDALIHPEVNFFFSFFSLSFIHFAFITPTFGDFMNKVNQE